jgi:hypothetical protein
MSSLFDPTLSFHRHFFDLNILNLNKGTVNDGAQTVLRSARAGSCAFLKSEAWCGPQGGATEAVMKALLALIIIYIGTFFLVIQGASQNSAQAAAPGSASAQDTAASAHSNLSIDRVKEADIRSLMELVGARDMVQDGANNAIEQSREKLLTTVPNNDKGHAFVNAFSVSYQKKFDADQVTEQLVGIYDKHFTDDEIKGLLQFYGSPLGQKVAAEMPKINREAQAAVRSVSGKAAREALAEVKQQNPEVGQSARLGMGQGRLQQRRGQRPQLQAAQQEQDPR